MKVCMLQLSIVSLSITNFIPAHLKNTLNFLNIKIIRRFFYEGKNHKQSIKTHLYHVMYF